MIGGLPEPYWQDEARGLRLFCGDARTILPYFADGEFGGVITDPPYGVGKKEYLDVPPDSGILKECLRVSAGTVVMWGGAPTRSQLHFLSLEPAPDRTLIWNPSFSRAGTRSNGIFWRWHPIHCWRLPANTLGMDSDILNEPCWGKRIHFFHVSAKPLSIMLRVVGSFGGASVLDPYAGSGTTGAACAKLGIPCTLIEIDEGYCRMIVARLTEDLSYGEPNLFNLQITEATHEH